LLRCDRSRDAASEQHFLNEGRRLASVRHPNVLMVHGASRHDGRMGLWTDLIDGVTLEQSLKSMGPLGPEEAVHIGIDLCRALAAVHAAGLVHADVKTANVMRERGGRIVLMDFSTVTPRPARTKSDGDRVSGTPLYMAPELFRGAEPSISSDLYSLGVVLYRLVSGRFPVEATRLSELHDKHQRAERSALRDVRADLPTAYVQAVERATDPQPDRRYRSAGEMEKALLEVSGNAPSTSRSSGPTKSWVRPLLGAAVGALVMAVLVVWLIGGWPFGPFEVEIRLYRIGDGIEARSRCTYTY
jgi:serine/threonine-protein kinase